MRNPRLISNSGGRTSGLMTFMQIAKGLGPDDYIVFANTGKEREETLEFLHNQEKEWGVKIWWIEYCPFNRWKEVSFETASRNGEPFEQLIYKRNFVPNPMARYCTQELKIRVMRDFMRSQGYSHWVNLVGIRYDEPRRIAKSKAGANTDRWDNEYPLHRSEIVKADVEWFWRKQPFNLQLLPHEGNCDLCFLKGRGKLLHILRNEPERADWWIEMETTTGTAFKNGMRFEYLKAKAQTDLFPEFYGEPSIECFCGD